MGKFHSTFYFIGRKDDFSPEAWRPFFQSDKVDQWIKDESGVIQFENDHGDKYSLTMNYVDRKGVAISYDRYNFEDKLRNFSLFAQGETVIGPQFEFLENGTAVPVGSFLSLDTVWSVVESFLRYPELKPPSVTWVDSDSPSLQWPDELL